MTRRATTVGEHRINRVHTDRRHMNLQRGGAVASFHEWAVLCKACHHRCLCCRQPLPLEKLRRDHIIPISKPWSRNGIENLQPLCEKCNSLKSDMTIDFRPTSSLVLESLPEQLKNRVRVAQAIAEAVTTTEGKSKKELRKEARRIAHEAMLAEHLARKVEKKMQTSLKELDRANVLVSKAVAAKSELEILKARVGELRRHKQIQHDELNRVHKSYYCLPAWLKFVLVRHGFELPFVPSNADLVRIDTEQRGCVE